MEALEDWVKQVKEEYNKLSADEILEEFVALNDELNEYNKTDDYSKNYKLIKERYEIARFLILERLKYFDCGDDDIINFT